jgi:hypothetical protein
MKMAGVLSAFDAWRDNVEERNHLRQLMSKIVRRMKMAGVLSAFAAWRDNVEERIRVRQLLQRVSFRMQNQAAAMALRTWAQHHFDSARIRAALSRGSVMRARRATAEAWYSWVEVVDAELARRRVEERARALEQEMAARSMGASRATAFLTVTLPQVRFAVLTGAFLAFITSLDEVVVAMFVSGGENATITRRMFNSLRDQIDPTIAAISTIMIVITSLLLAASQWSGKSDP